MNRKKPEVRELVTSALDFRAFSFLEGQSKVITKKLQNQILLPSTNTIVKSSLSLFPHLEKKCIYYFPESCLYLIRWFKEKYQP